MNSVPFDKGSLILINMVKFIEIFKSIVSFCLQESSNKYVYKNIRYKRYLVYGFCRRGFSAGGLMSDFDDYDEYCHSESYSGDSCSSELEDEASSLSSISLNDSMEVDESNDEQEDRPEDINDKTKFEDLNFNGIVAKNKLYFIDSPFIPYFFNQYLRDHYENNLILILSRIISILNNDIKISSTIKNIILPFQYTYEKNSNFIINDIKIEENNYVGIINLIFKIYDIPKPIIYHKQYPFIPSLQFQNFNNNNNNLVLLDDLSTSSQFYPYIHIHHKGIWEIRGILLKELNNYEYIIFININTIYYSGMKSPTPIKFSLVKNILSRKNIVQILVFYKRSCSFSSVYNFIMTYDYLNYELNEIMNNITTNIQKYNHMITINKNQLVNIYKIINIYRRELPGVILNDPPGKYINLISDR